MCSCSTCLDVHVVDHALRAAEAGTRLRSHDVFTKSMAFEARKLQDMFKRRLGVDITIFDAFNPFWHTGNLVNMWGHNFRQLRPWEWIWRVASGSVPGKGRASTGGGRGQSWVVFVHKFIENIMFGF